MRTVLSLSQETDVSVPLHALSSMGTTSENELG